MRLFRFLKDAFVLLLLFACMQVAFSQIDSTDQVISDTLYQHEHLFTDETVQIEIADITVTGIATDIVIQLAPSLQEVARAEMEINGKNRMVEFEDGRAEISVTPQQSRETITLRLHEYQREINLHSIPLWLSIVPPLIAILLALLFKEVIVSLFIGTFAGAAIIEYFHQDSFLGGIGSGLLEVIDTYFLRALYDPGDPGFGHISVIVFSLLIGGVVAIISRNGGMQGVVNRISVYAKSPRSGQFATWLLGVIIFFDDYANTLVVGNTMRSVTDRLRISREKLAYLVDSTAAPVAALAFITTWIGAELGYIESGITGLDGFPEGVGPYSIFLHSLAYSFYPILTLIFMLILIYTGRDIGPMYEAEVRTRTTGVLGRPPEGKGNLIHDDDLDEFQPVPGAIPKAYNAIIPILVLISGVLIGMISTGMSATHDALVEAGARLADTGWGSTWREMALLSETGKAGSFRKLGILIGNSDSYYALLWASLSAVIVAIAITVGQRIMKLNEAVDTMTNGFKAMFGAVIILVLAWSLALVTADMHTADFLTRLLEGNISIVLIPMLTFILGGLVAFATGSSWGTMAILYPLMIPTAWKIAADAGIPPEEAMSILYNVVSAVLAGSVLGDHCSPISDTTILSSLATSCNHIDHVRTQLPYALIVGGVAILLGTLPASLGVPGWITFPVCVGTLIGIVRVFGKEVEPASV